MRPPARFPVPLVLMLALALPAAAAANDPSTPGALSVVKPDGTVVEMPLAHTKVAIEVTAFVARATIEQVFKNPFPDPVEAVYTFPLGHQAAVDDFELVVGSRTIRGEIKRREEARAAYQQARAAGYQAALLEQERPNMFTQSVANLEPGKTITVRLRTVETLRYERGTYRLTFPLVVGPRYIPGSVADAARIAPPVLAPGTRSGHDVEISVTIDAGVPLEKLESPSHRIKIVQAASRAASVQLADDDTIPNKDFLLRWSVSSERPALGLLTHRAGLDGFFTLLVQPKGEIGPAEAMPKEITFVLDTSGSMSGIPIEASKRFVAKALHAMGPRDTFNLIRFAGDNEVYAKQSLANEPASIEAALAWFNRQGGAGGTEMLPALKTAFMLPADPNRLRMVVFLTDGYVGNEDEILGAIGKVLGDARIYTVGIGSSVNHHLLDRMAGLGRGAYVFVRPDDSADDALEAFRSWVTLPYVTDLSIDWGGLPIADVNPAKLPDLGSGQTLTLVGRYLDAGSGNVVVRGRVGGRYFEQSLRVALPASEAKNESLGSLWARTRIEGMLGDPENAALDSTKAEVTELALAYRLMSPFTSFVAIDDSRVVNPSGNPMTVHQALPLPEGVSYDAVGGVVGGVAGGVEGDTVEEVSVRLANVAMEDKAKPVAKASRADRPESGSFHQNVLALSPGAPEPNVNGARERSFNAQMLLARPPVQPQVTPVDSKLETDDGLMNTAFRLLADIADDGKLSAAEGKPALAAILAAQRKTGALSEQIAAHAVATWALGEAVAIAPGNKTLRDARDKATRYLIESAQPAGWPSRPGWAIDAEATRWARLVLGSRLPDAQKSIPVPAGQPSERFTKIRASLAAARSGAPAVASSGQSAFDRLVRTISRRNLKTV